MSLTFLPFNPSYLLPNFCLLLPRIPFTQFFPISYDSSSLNLIWTLCIRKSISFAIFWWKGNSVRKERRQFLTHSIHQFLVILQLVCSLYNKDSNLWNLAFPNKYSIPRSIYIIHVSRVKRFATRFAELHNKSSTRNAIDRTQGSPRRSSSSSWERILYINMVKIWPDTSSYGLVNEAASKAPR